MIEQKIIAYLKQISSGMVKINEKHASHIVDIVVKSISTHAVAKLFRKNNATELWENTRNIKTTDDAIMKVKEKHVYEGLPKPEQQFYMYDLYFEDGKAAGKIYSFDQFLFD